MQVSGTNSRIGRTDMIVSTEINGAVVILSIEQGNYYTLDEIGSRIWRILDSPKTVSDICDVLVAEYEVARATCEADLVSFLEELTAERILRVENQPV